eukprot:9065236-Pyramimonas_sp.AAC.1
MREQVAPQPHHRGPHLVHLSRLASPRLLLSLRVPLRAGVPRIGTGDPRLGAGEARLAAREAVEVAQREAHAVQHRRGEPEAVQVPLPRAERLPLLRHVRRFAGGRGALAGKRGTLAPQHAERGVELREEARPRPGREAEVQQRARQVVGGVRRARRPRAPDRGGRGDPRCQHREGEGVQDAHLRAQAPAGAWLGAGDAQAAAEGVRPGGEHHHLLRHRRLQPPRTQPNLRDWPRTNGVSGGGIYPWIGPMT